MSLPITSQAVRVRTDNRDARSSTYEYVIRTKQGKPYNEPAPYTLRRTFTLDARLYGSTTSFGGQANAGADSGEFHIGPGFADNYCTTQIAQAVNSAREKLMAQLGESALMAVNYVERMSAVNMIHMRSLQLLRFSRALKRCDIFAAAKELNVKGPSSLPSIKNGRWRRSRDYANAWLEFHFGWEPLIQDIGNCVEILQGPVPGGKFYARGKRISIDKEFASRQTTGYKECYVHRRTGHVQASCYGEFFVTNPDLYLAKQLGFINPAAVAWELIPFSFVVDWFANVGQFLDQFSDLSGLTIVRPGYSWVVRVPSSLYTYHYTLSGKLQGMEVEGMGLFMKRFRGFPSVTLGLRPLKRLSVVRAATAISLLTQFLGKK